jgi:hypothetical protein
MATFTPAESGASKLSLGRLASIRAVCSPKIRARSLFHASKPARIFSCTRANWRRRSSSQAYSVPSMRIDVPLLRDARDMAHKNAVDMLRFPVAWEHLQGPLVSEESGWYPYRLPEDLAEGSCRIFKGQVGQSHFCRNQGAQSRLPSRDVK